MRKPERSKKRRMASLKRATKRSKRTTNAFRRDVSSKKLFEKQRAKIAAEKRFKQHLNDLMGKK